MRRFFDVAGGVAYRGLKKIATNPQLLLPSLIFPLFFFVAFAGGLSSVGDVPGFDFPSGYTAFQFVFVLLQAAAFGGGFTGFGIAADYENGFAQRLLLGAPRRTGILAGYVGSGAVRFLATSLVVTSAGLIAGMHIDGGAADLVGLWTLGLLVSATGTLFAAGVSLRAKSMQAAPAMQIPIFLTLFLAPVYVPLDLLQGWIHTVAGVNPATALLEAGRGFVSGREDHSALAVACGAGLVALMFVFALRGLRRAEAGE